MYSTEGGGARLLSSWQEQAEVGTQQETETEEQEGGGTGRARRTTVAMGGVLGRLFKVKKLELVLVGIENS
jgi:hypothetical protein